MLVVGPVCKRIPNCPPKISKILSYSNMIAFPQWVQPRAAPGTISSPVCFFLCPNGNTMG
ncbi:hypothetical protein DPMN_097037 [Dreissena polymorpha]|uniref:Uncharacterized protein n=2 Tax=Dreissena polymorpha TaxID=45954 RepID=A0A9D4LB09_DREPO|nr:hypothetical protein DPMN_097037 [Dreissena polymorpha]